MTSAKNSVGNLNGSWPILIRTARLPILEPLDISVFTESPKSNDSEDPTKAPPSLRMGSSSGRKNNFAARL
jgi:hypothetical protein